MNPVIEKYMESIKDKERMRVEENKQTDVSDEQMAVQWQKIRGKFEALKHKNSQNSMNKEDEPVQKKPRFLKPVD